MLAVAGATTKHSAQRASSVCGLTEGRPNSDSTGGTPVIAANVCGPRNLVEALVRIVRTSAPRSTRRLARYAALYAATPPETPRTMRRPSSTTSLLGVDDDLVVVDLFERDGERLA